MDFFVGIITKIAIDITRAITPPSLFGIDHRIVYANRKYHSGWMCTGVTRGFVGMKFSGSLKMYSSFRVNIVTIVYYLVCMSTTHFQNELEKFVLDSSQFIIMLVYF
jgi:hypothetical protein